ncbi:MAG: hypothetical protein IH885_01230 [Myxococcales bacterium]|nr:hypothetical protein [Myxococcales bacterium]
MTMATLCSGFLTILKAALPHLLALMIALWAGRWVYRRGQDEKLNRSLAALLFDSSQNLVVLEAVIQQSSWREDSIDPRFADPTVARALLSDTSIFSANLDRGLVIAAVHYTQQMEAVRMAMQFIAEHFVEHGRLTERNLRTLDRVCRSGIIAIRVLQRRLDSEISKRKIRIGTNKEGREFAEELERELEKVNSEVLRESREVEAQ